MANRLKMAVVDAIYTLLERGCSQRWIALTLGINRETVQRYARLARSKPAGAPPGSPGPEPPPESNHTGAPPGSSVVGSSDGVPGGSKPATAPSRPMNAAGPVQPSSCAPFHEVILAKLEQGLSAKRIWQDLVAEHGFSGEEKVLARYLKPDLLIIDDFGMKQLPKRSGEYLFEIIMRRYEVRSTMMTSNRPLEDWGKLIGHVPAATAILDRFLHHAEVITITGRSYRLKDRAVKPKPSRGGELESGRSCQEKDQ